MSKRKLRVFEAFAGIGAQASALSRMNIDYEIVGISDWYVDAIECYAAIHCSNIKVDMPEDIKEIDDYLSQYTFSATSVKETKLKLLTEDQRRDLYRANIQSNNFGSITELKGKDMPETDLLVYSFPCQDLSTGGLGKGMAKGSGTRSGLLWEIERILQELKELGRLTEFDDLQIINGGQTTATLAATNIKNNADLSGIFVQMKLTVLKDSDPDLIRNIAKYANSQNKVKTADLNSSHPFYVRMEDFSRKVYAPLASGSLVQQLWFFERARGQYEQPLMQMTKAQANNYKLTRPKNMKFTLTDLAKYMNAANMLPHYVSWGGEVNAAHFHNEMEKQWNKNDAVYNELFYKELIGKKILFAKIENVISDQQLILLLKLGMRNCFKFKRMEHKEAQQELNK